MEKFQTIFDKVVVSKITVVFTGIIFTSTLVPVLILSKPVIWALNSTIMFLILLTFGNVPKALTAVIHGWPSQPKIFGNCFNNSLLVK